MSELHDIHHRPIARPATRRASASRTKVLGYLVGLALAVLLTATSFFVAGTDLVWQPSIPVAIIVLAIAQMGVHLVFFLHITTGADNTNNVMALAFGLLIVFLVIAGSLWIMDEPQPEHDADGSAHADAALRAGPAHKKGGQSAALSVAHLVARWQCYWQRCRRPSSPRNQVPGWQTKPFGLRS